MNQILNLILNEITDKVELSSSQLYLIQCIFIEHMQKENILDNQLELFQVKHRFTMDEWNEFFKHI